MEKTTDVSDQHPEARILPAVFRDFGGRVRFSGNRAHRHQGHWGASSQDSPTERRAGWCEARHRRDICEHRRQRHRGRDGVLLLPAAA